MAEYKQVDLQIGTEAQFETKKETLPVGTIVGLTDPIHVSELDSDLQTSIDSIANKLDKPSGNPTEDSLVKVSSTGSTSYFALSTLVDLESEQIIVGVKTIRNLHSGNFYVKNFDCGRSQDGKSQHVFITGTNFVFKDWDDGDSLSERRTCNAPLFRGYLDELNTQLPTFAQNPPAAPAVDSVTVYEATTAKPVWKPLSELAGVQTFKTLFGNQSITGSGNIDLYKHNIKGASGSSTFYLRIYSSNNLKANSLTDLKTLLGSTFEESCTGSNGIMAITQDKVLFNDGTDASISGYTITDDVKTI